MEERIHAKKRFGQNFLKDEAILEKIADSALLAKEDVVLEIGPGTGALTARLALRAKRVIAVEIDTSLRPSLSSLPDNVTVLFQDILKTDLDTLRNAHNDGKAFKVVANLPYYISTPVIMKLLRDRIPPASCTVMVQKEMAMRMAAHSGNKDYGALSVAVQYYALPEVICDVPPHAFTPMPKVNSCVLRLMPLAHPPVAVKDTSFFFRVVEASFAHRRKTLVNSLRADNSLHLDRTRIEEALVHVLSGEASGAFLMSEEKLSPEDAVFIRAERLTIEQFAALSDFLYC